MRVTKCAPYICLAHEGPYWGYFIHCYYYLPWTAGCRTMTVTWSGFAVTRDQGTWSLSFPSCKGDSENRHLLGCWSSWNDSRLHQLDRDKERLYLTICLLWKTFALEARFYPGCPRIPADSSINNYLYKITIKFLTIS
jgi:hypothetical protein